MNRSVSFRMRVLAALSPVLALLALAGCGGGASTTENPADDSAAARRLHRPAAGEPGRAGVQAQRLGQPAGGRTAAASAMARAARCRASCAATTSTSPTRPRTASSTSSNPSDSMMVTKVGGGHNCWLAADSACADQLTVWIRNWAGQTLGGTRGAPLQPPPIKDVGASKSFPAELGAVRLDRLPGADAVLLALPFLGRDHAAVAVLRRSRRRRRLRRGAREDQPRLAGPVAPRRAPARRVPQLLDRLRHGCERHAGRDRGLRRRRAAHAGRPGPRDLQGADAL